MRMAHLIEPGLVVETDGVDNEGVSLPFSDRIAHPAWVQVFRMRPGIRPDLADIVTKFVDDEHAPGYRENFHGKIEKINSRHAGRVALQSGVVGFARVTARVRGLRGFVFRRGPRR